MLKPSGKIGGMFLLLINVLVGIFNMEMTWDCRAAYLITL